MSFTFCYNKKHYRSTMKHKYNIENEKLSFMKKSAICWPSYLYSLIPERALFFAIISQNDIPLVALPSPSKTISTL